MALSIARLVTICLVTLAATTQQVSGAPGATPAPAPTVKLGRHAPGWQRRSHAPAGTNLRLHFALRQADDGRAIERHLLSVSNPNSPHFRKHLDSRQVTSLSAPSREGVSAIEQWLSEYGLLVRPGGDRWGVYDVSLTVKQAEALLNTTYHVYSDGTRDVIRTDKYHLPARVAPHVDFVTPTISFPRASKLKGAESRQAAARAHAAGKRALSRRDTCGTGDRTTPTCIRQVYGINSYTAQANRTTFAVYATEGATYRPSDTQAFLEENNPAAARASPSYQVVGNGDSANPDGGIAAAFEIGLDTQTLLGLAWPASGIVYNNGGVFGPAKGQVYDRFVHFLSELIRNDTVPSVVSVSESFPEDQLDPAYARRLCSMMAQVGARGVTLLFSSGNNGPSGDSPDGTHKAVFEPEFPASCPWVTAVGGTTDLAAEKAATQTTLDPFTRTFYTASGGGFSALFPRPRYQKAPVGRYVRTHVPPSYANVSGFNPHGRGVPDVSAFSTDFPAVAQGLSVPVGGTSAATPVWAAVITLLNDHEASRGRPPLGFVNPWLYSLRSSGALSDITAGGNNAGACNPLAGCTLDRTPGYNVTEGWDAVTGLGSPVFNELLAALDDCERGRRGKADSYAHSA